MQLVNNPEKSLFIDKPLLQFFELVAIGDFRPFLITNEKELEQKFSSFNKVEIKYNSETQKVDINYSDALFLYKYEKSMCFNVERKNRFLFMKKNTLILKPIHPKEEEFTNFEMTPYVGNNKFHNSKWFRYHQAFEIEDDRVRKQVGEKLQNSQSEKDFGFGLSKVVHKAFDIIDYFKRFANRYEYNLRNPKLDDPDNLIVYNGISYLNWLLKGFYFKYSDYLFSRDFYRISEIIDRENRGMLTSKTINKDLTENPPELKNKTAFKWIGSKTQLNLLHKLLMSHLFIYDKTANKQFEFNFNGKERTFIVKPITWISLARNGHPNKKALCYLLKILVEKYLIQPFEEPKNAKHKNFKALVLETFRDRNGSEINISNANIRDCSTNEYCKDIDLIIKKILNISKANQNV